MSLVTYTPHVVTAAEAIASDLKAKPRKTFLTFLADWEDGISQLWDGDTAGILAALGTSAEDLFTDSNAAIAFLETQLPGSTDAGVAKIRAFTINQDGSVTLD